MKRFKSANPWYRLSFVMVWLVFYTAGLVHGHKLGTGENTQPATVLHLLFDPVANLAEGGFALGVKLERNGETGDIKTFFVPPGDRHTLWSPDGKHILGSFEIAEAKGMDGA